MHGNTKLKFIAFTSWFSWNLSHLLDILHTKFYANRPKNVQNRAKNLVMSISNVWFQIWYSRWPQTGGGGLFSGCEFRENHTLLRCINEFLSVLSTFCTICIKRGIRDIHIMTLIFVVPCIMLNSEMIPTRCNNCVYSSQWLYSKCFGWQFYPSSGVQCCIWPFR